MHVFAVLGDETRRRMVETLAEREQSVGDLVARFHVSQPAVSQHLRVLREAGLVQMRPQGQRRLYSIRPGGLRPVELWLERHRRYLAGKLDDLERYLDESEEQTK